MKSKYLNIFKKKKAREMLYKEFSYKDFDPSGFSLDLQGWNSDKPTFSTLIDRFISGLNNSSLIIEVGSWKGLSAVNMGKRIKAKGLDCEIVCIDTWLGSWEHWTEADLYKEMKIKAMRPRLYEQFLYNVIHENLTDIITPFPQTSTTAYKILKKKGIKADLIYVDGSHDQGDVYEDIRHYFELLKNGGILFGDDYGGAWKGVKHDVDQFAKENKLKLEVQGVFWVVNK